MEIDRAMDINYYSKSLIVMETKKLVFIGDQRVWHYSQVQIVVVNVVADFSVLEKVVSNRYNDDFGQIDVEIMQVVTYLVDCNFVVIMDDCV